MRIRPCFIAAAVAIFVPVALAANGGASGDLDPTFGTGGLVLVRPSDVSRAEAAVVQPNGKVVLAGIAADWTSFPYWGKSDFLALRLNRNGSLDQSFGVGGIVPTPIDLGDTNSDFAEAVALGPDGSIVVAGEAGKANNETDMAVVRYTPSGALDSSFSGDGILTLDKGQLDDLRGVAVQPDGKIVAVGYAGSGFLVIRLLSNGALDESFGSAGVVDTNVGDPQYQDIASAVVVLGDGKIVVAGTSDRDYPSYSPVPVDFAVVRYLPDGQRDSTFGEDGIVVTSGPAMEIASGLVATSDGKIVVVGDTGWPSPGPRFPGTSSFHLVRYLSSGALDPTFGAGGTVTTSFGGSPEASHASSVALELDGKIIAGGGHIPGRWPYTASGRFALARYNDDGTLDDTFGVGGKRTYDVSSGHDWGSALAIQRSAARSGADRLVFAGMAHGGTGGDVAAIGVDLGPPPPAPPVRCRVPRVVGLTLSRARVRLRSAHCKVGRVRRARSTRRRGRVASQHPRAGRSLPSGSRVNLVVSRGR